MQKCFHSIYFYICICIYREEYVTLNANEKSFYFSASQGLEVLRGYGKNDDVVKKSKADQFKLTPDDRA